jgi:pantoate--beta-alanine ligase
MLVTMSSLTLPALPAAQQVKLVTTAHELRLCVAAWRKHDETIGFVPTMGALHQGHLELVRRSQDLTTRTIVSIFVNPKQFTEADDLTSYPRDLAADQTLLASVGCDLLYAPGLEEIYPAGFATEVKPGPLANIFEGAHRPGHFTGVATVVTKLLLQAAPDYAFFGEKDYQQLRVIENTVRDLALPVSIVPVPTMRDTDGLALSSRNRRLSADARQQAGYLPEILFETAEQLRQGYPLDLTMQEGRKKLAEAGFKIDYFELIDSRTFVPMTTLRKPARLLVAAWMGDVRLIDNVDVFGAF